MDCKPIGKKGWITIPPLVLLVNGHIECFVREMKYLPSHISQLLDVSFFKPLKIALEKACNDYHLDVKLISVLAGVLMRLG